MARARFIRPEFWRDIKVSELPFGARLLFQCTWNMADLRGVFEHSAKFMRAEAFPHDEGVKLSSVQEWLDQLEALAMVLRFEAEGKSWGYVRNWLKWQEISNREIEIGSDRPEPPEWVDPPKWLEVWEKSPRCRNRSRTVLEPKRNPSASASTSTSSTASVTGGRAHAKAPSASAEDSWHGVKKSAVRQALDADDLIALVRAFGGDLSGNRLTEWPIRAGHHIPAVIAVVMAGEVAGGSPIRQPSGLQKALALWDEDSKEVKKAAAAEFCRQFAWKPTKTAKEAS